MGSKQDTDLLSSGLMSRMLFPLLILDVKPLVFLKESERLVNCLFVLVSKFELV